MIIPILHIEKIVQVKDLTRFDASKSVLVKGSVGAITSVKIKMGASGPEIDCFNSLQKNWFVDFAFNTAGDTEITLTVETATESESIVETVTVLTKEEDALFSSDSDLVGFENDIMKWLPQGRGTFLDLHRKAQRLIIEWIDRKGYRDDKNAKLTKLAFVDNTEVQMWATYMTLKLFFMGAQNATDDVFKRKAEYYAKLEIEARDRTSLTLDLNGDGVKDKSTTTDIGSGRLFFR
jgi:hypothetical protein